MTTQPAQSAPITFDWVHVNDFIKSPVGAQFFTSYSSFQWMLRKHRRRLIETGALIKTGKSLAVSISRAPAVIEDIYREQSLAALDRTAA
ncbi:MAG: hypothetical protein KBF66_13545 [Rhodoferax sp.]|uniref:hypothetical protein n=1 Tax=Rhodoferax sp. TaxID=50421 RepID=UPI001B528227|nr:hypothetical protein [Rhodoferax sp.]MBP9906580.1 hypothetical protein [Rhodoferax sp.]